MLKLKYFILLFILFILFGVSSCSNNNTATIAPPTSDTTKVTSDYTPAMVDNKKDLVCNMPVSAGIGDTAHYKGKVYGFCSAECKEAFLKKPEYFLAKIK